MRKVMPFMKPYVGSAVCAVIFTTLNWSMNLLLPLLMSKIINNGISDERIGYIFFVGAVMVIISVLGVLSAVVSSYSSAKASTGFGMEIRKAIFRKVESLSQSDIDKIGASSLITRSTNDINQIQELTLLSLRIIIAAPIMMVGGTFMAFTINKALSTILFAIVPIIAAAALFVMKKVSPLFSKIQKKNDELNQTVRERLGGVRVIRAFNKSGYEQERFDKTNIELVSLSLKINRIFALLIPFAYFVLYTTVTSLIYFASKQVNRLDLSSNAQRIADTVGDLQAFVVYLLLILAAVGMAAAVFVQLPKASVSASRIAEVLSLLPSIEDGTEALGDSGREAIEFENVGFSYDDSDEPVLSDISFTAPKGKVTAVIGGTGSGKSTLVNLIPRFYDVKSGRILLNGVDIRNLPLGVLHKTVAFVPQKTTLFSGTIEENLRYGKDNASATDMWNALKTAQAEEFVKASPRGLKTRLSQNATNLSGGQRQRLSIARALIRKADYYIFDDSFSALDFKTDSDLRKSVKKDFSQSGLIIVAQRVGTIMDADNIIVLEDGKIAGQGKHRELFESCGIYREICLSQLNEDEIY